MKVKIFRMAGSSFGFGKKKNKPAVVFENEINEWLAANPGVKISEIKQTMCGGSLDPDKTLISIWYE